MSAVSYTYFKPQAVASFLGDGSQVIPLLQVVQEEHGYVPEGAIKEICDITGTPESDIFSVITFYKQFRLQPPGKYLIKVCDGTACHVMGSSTLLDVLYDTLKIETGDTTADGLFTISPVACLGCCSLAPVIMVNDETFGNLTPQKVRTILNDFRKKG